MLIEEETGGEEVLADRLPLLGVPLSVKESFFVQGKPVVDTVSLYTSGIQKFVKVNLRKTAFILRFSS